MPRLLLLIEDLTNWYIRFNRQRLKGQTNLGNEDTLCALNTLCEVLFVLVRVLAPFMPFLTDHIYGLMVPHLGSSPIAGVGDRRSVHFLAFPDTRESLFDPIVERRVLRMRKVIELARSAREKRAVTLKTPLRTLVVIASPEYAGDVRSLNNYVRGELNVRDLVLTSDEDRYHVRLRAVPNWPRIGQRLKRDAQSLRRALPALDEARLRAFVRDKRMVVNGVELDEEDLIVVKEVDEVACNSGRDPEGPMWTPLSDSEALILLDTTLYPDLMDEGLVRDLISRFQRLRKQAGLSTADDVRMEYSVVKNPAAVEIQSIIAAQREKVRGALLGDVKEATSSAEEGCMVEETQELSGLTLALRLLRT